MLQLCIVGGRDSHRKGEKEYCKMYIRVSTKSFAFDEVNVKKVQFFQIRSSLKIKMYYDIFQPLRFSRIDPLNKKGPFLNKITLTYCTFK